MERERLGCEGNDELYMKWKGKGWDAMDMTKCIWNGKGKDGMRWKWQKVAPSSNNGLFALWFLVEMWIYGAAYTRLGVKAAPGLVFISRTTWILFQGPCNRRHLRFSSSHKGSRDKLTESWHSAMHRKKYIVTAFVRHKKQLSVTLIHPSRSKRGSVFQHSYIILAIPSSILLYYISALKTLE